MTTAFSTGILNLLTKTEAQTEAGGMPKEALSSIGWTYYQEKMVTHTRMYEAKGVNREIDKLIRVPEDIAVRPDMYVQLEDGYQYRIDSVADVIVNTDLRCKELTLVRLERLYDIVD